MDEAAIRRSERARVAWFLREATARLRKRETTHEELKGHMGQLLECIATIIETEIP